MAIENPQWADAGHTLINATVDGRPGSIPAVQGNRHYDELIASGAPFAPFVAAAPGAADIKLEARRRILARFPEWKQANMTARGVELVGIRVVAGAWSEEEASEAEALGAAWDWIKAVRAASDALEMATPDDFKDDKHWPAVPS